MQSNYPLGVKVTWSSRTHYRQSCIGKAPIHGQCLHGETILQHLA